MCPVAARKRELWQTGYYSARFLPALLAAGKLRQASLRVADGPQEKRLLPVTEKVKSNPKAGR